VKNTIKSVSLAAVVVLAATMLLAASAMAQPGKKGGGMRSFIKPVITAEQAITAVKAALPGITAGKTIVKTGKRGEQILDVTLVLNATIVSRVKLNPATGEIMIKGQDVMVQEVLASQGQATKVVQEAIPKLEVASVHLGKEGQWIVDLTLNKGVVASIGVHSGNGSILPDWKASQDASMY
jgi:hypothetical protein